MSENVTEKYQRAIEHIDSVPIPEDPNQRLSLMDIRDTAKTVAKKTESCRVSVSLSGIDQVLRIEPESHWHQLLVRNAVLDLIPKMNVTQREAVKNGRELMWAEARESGKAVDAGSNPIKD